MSARADVLLKSAEYMPYCFFNALVKLPNNNSNNSKKNNLIFFEKVLAFFVNRG